MVTVVWPRGCPWPDSSETSIPSIEAVPLAASPLIVVPPLPSEERPVVVGPAPGPLLGPVAGGSGETIEVGAGLGGPIGLSASGSGGSVTSFAIGFAANPETGLTAYGIARAGIVGTRRASTAQEMDAAQGAVVHRGELPVVP